MDGFFRVTCAVPSCRPGDVDGNVASILALMDAAAADETDVVVFPELCLSGYTVRDLFLDQTLQRQCLLGLKRIVDHSHKQSPLFFVGLPLTKDGALFNVAVAVQRGRVLAVVPKSHLPNYREFEERRFFTSGLNLRSGSTVHVLGQDVPMGTDVLFACADNDVVVGCEICEDIWVPEPPSMRQVKAGATVVVNLSASNFTVGKADLRRLLCTSASDRGKCAYVYVAAGPGESSTDLAFDADAFVCENGSVLCESRRFLRTAQHLSVDVDIDALVRERQVTGTFFESAHDAPVPVFRRVAFAGHPRATSRALMRHIPAHPFLPRDEKTLATRAWETFEIQSNALATRMMALPTPPTLVLGLSGGLDSTHAALVCAQALDLCGRPRSDLICVTMPGLGTTATTKDNAVRLASDLSATLITLPIGEAARVVLEAVGHGSAAGTHNTDEVIALLRKDPRLGDPTFENAQARMRTLVLMTIANQRGGLVVGTGDMSEKALGWCTYAGDHIAMYDVNAGVPKTLIQFIIRWVANHRAQSWGNADSANHLKETLARILATPISPELLPPDVDGNIAQLTEERVGPYELHDFYLFHLVRHGRRPTRILDLAQVAFGERYSLDVHKRWLRVFVSRFFSQQFKRSCATDGPKVGTVALSPRGDWRMPSDAVATAWLAEIDSYLG